MSGVEVAGLLLAAFPLAISALEHYRETAETLGTFWKIRREYKTWTHSFNICRLAFEQNLEEFLLPLIADEDELQRLLAEPGGQEWKNPELEQRLKQRLPKSYELYLESMDRIKDVLEQLRHELGIDKIGFQKKVVENDAENSLKPSKPSMDVYMSKANFEFQTRRIKMSFGQAKRDKLFERLTDYNNELRTLLDTSDRIAALRQNNGRGKKSSVNRGLWQFWRHADRLYNLITQSWRCECKTFHQAHLLLQHRTTSKVDFKIMFIYAQQSFNKPKPWLWTFQETNIKLLEDQWQPLSATPAASTPLISAQKLPPIKAIVVPEPMKSSFRKSMIGKFKREQADSSGINKNPSTKDSSDSTEILTPPVAIPQVTFTAASNTAQSVDDADMIDIKNLCDTIAAYRSNLQHRSCLKGEQSRFSLSPSGSHESMADTRSTVSLGELLSKASSYPLTRRQRYLIALTLASSHLQLHSTPWITSRWSKNDILFLRHSTSPEKVLLDQPYISRNFAPVVSTSEISEDRSLSSLGIMLLELCFGVALEDHESRRKYPLGAEPNPFLDMAAALEWSPRVVEEAGPEFADAISWCLHNMPGSGESDGKLDKWREELFLKVVEPLKYCYDQLTSVVR